MPELLAARISHKSTSTSHFLIVIYSSAHVYIMLLPLIISTLIMRKYDYHNSVAFIVRRYLLRSSKVHLISKREKRLILQALSLG